MFHLLSLPLQENIAMCPAKKNKHKEEIDKLLKDIKILVGKPENSAQEHQKKLLTMKWQLYFNGGDVLEPQPEHDYYNGNY